MRWHLRGNSASHSSPPVVISPRKIDQLTLNRIDSKRSHQYQVSRHRFCNQSDRAAPSSSFKNQNVKTLPNNKRHLINLLLRKWIQTAMIMTLTTMRTTKPHKVCKTLHVYSTKRLSKVDPSDGKPQNKSKRQTPSESVTPARRP